MRNPVTEGAAWTLSKGRRRSTHVDRRARGAGWPDGLPTPLPQHRCKTCRHAPISAGATFCPQCGEPHPAEEVVSGRMLHAWLLPESWLHRMEETDHDPSTYRSLGDAHSWFGPKGNDSDIGFRIARTKK